MSNKLAGLQSRCMSLNGLDSTGSNLSGLDKVFGAALASDPSKGMINLEGKPTAAAEVLRLAREKVPSAMKAIHALRVEQIDLYVRATSNFAMFYEAVPLKDNEQAMIENTYRNPVRVRYLAEDGGGRTVKAVKSRSQTHLNMRLLKSDRLGYQIRDLQAGTDLEAASNATADIAWDVTNKLDVEAFNFLLGGTINGVSYGTGVFGAFRTTGAPLARTWVQHPRINSANLPTKNDYSNSDLDDYGSSTDNGLFRPSVIRKIMDHCDSFGTILGGRPLSPTGVILVPSSEVNSLARGINPFGARMTEVGEGVQGNFTTFSYFKNRNWTLVPDVTLPKGRCYVVLDRPVGKLFTKPSFDQEFVDTDLENNWEERSAQKAISFATLEPWRVGALRIAYNNSPAALTSNE